MKLIFAAVGLLLLASCVGNVDSAKLVLREPNDSASIRTLTQRHELRITEDRMLVYNNKTLFEVPEDQMVIFESNDLEEPVFTLLDKEGVHFNYTFDF